MDVRKDGEKWKNNCAGNAGALAEPTMQLMIPQPLPCCVCGSNAWH